jgi:FMN phosphatase YigB (HAD superfamily)
MVDQLLTATEYMIQNDQPDTTLEQAFSSHFYAPLGLDQQQMQQPLQNFYQNVFPSLNHLTHTMPEAVDAVKQAVSKGYGIVIATNPLFPLLAITHRLAWAGLAVEDNEFLLVPSYDTTHFAKPNPAYFAELLAQTGWPEGPVVMVGNDQKLDIHPALEFGLPAFWVTNEEQQVHPCSMDGEPPWACGRIDELMPWIEKMPADQLLPRLKTPVGISATLKSTPAAISSMLMGVPETRIKKQPKPGEWSVLETICHLRDVDLKVNIPRVETIINEDNAFITGVDTDKWAEESEYRKQDVKEALDAFVKARMELLALIGEFNDSDWQRPAKHTIFGPTSMKELLQISARHDRLHMQTIYTCLN